MSVNHYKLPEAIVISCIDFRFHQKLKEALKKEEIGSYDILTLAGGAKNLAKPTKKIYQQTVIDNIKLAYKLHKIKTVVLCSHIDCGAYGGSDRFNNIKEEIKFHQAELRRAKDAIKKIPLFLKVKTILLRK